MAEPTGRTRGGADEKALGTEHREPLEGPPLERFRFVCRSCDKMYSSGFHPVCVCGGMVDVEYAVSRVRLREATNPLVRFFELLPIQSESSLCWLGDGNTPTVHARGIGGSHTTMLLEAS